jgi:uncharacterized protein (TIGR00369 family)
MFGAQPTSEVMMSAMLAQAKHVLASQPFSVLLGAEILECSHGRVELRVPVRPELLQQHGFVHGGVLSYAADNALTFVGGSVLGPAVVTSEFKINYFKPAVGDVVVARAMVVHQGKTQAVCRCDVLVGTGTEAETLCAVAQGTIALLSRGLDSG